MTATPVAFHGGGAIDSWDPLVQLAALFAVAVAILAVLGSRAGERDWLLWIPRGLERVTGIPGWAAATVGTASFGLAVAGVGFYNDVAWHVAMGRDEELFTAPHTMIVVGLWILALAGALGIIFATLDHWPARLRFRGLRVPGSAAVMLLIGSTALLGFPLDELWHAQFGIDVTMWSPTHLLMIVGASVTPLVSWLVLAEAGVRPRDSRWARGIHIVVAALALAGLSSVQGEFDFGVPQFQQLYLPVLVLLAGAFVAVAVRVAHGPGWALGVTAVLAAFQVALSRGPADVSLEFRGSAIYIGTAAAVEITAWLLGTERRTRFAVASALSVATLGLGVEWWWNQGASQPWTAALLPDALLLGLLAAGAAALLGAAVGDILIGNRPAIAPRALAAAGLGVLVALALPLPRPVGDVEASVTLDRTPGGNATIETVLDPPDAADGARWFQVVAWQGGGLVIADMERVGVGRWRSDRPVPIEPPWKTLVRLHRGAEMMAVPVFLPDDPEIGEPEIPAVDRVAAFERESRYLLREQRPGSAAFAWLVPGVVLGFAALWVVSWITVARRVFDSDREVERAASR